MKIDINKRMAERTDKSDDCWKWNHSLDHKGYPVIWYNKKLRKGSHVALILSGVDVPSGTVVCHKCDEPLCVNPAHLYIGTTQQNVADRQRRGRQAKGITNGGGGKLSVDDVLMIKSYSRKGLTTIKVGEMFNVSNVMIGNIWRGKSWSHIQEVF